MHKNKPYTGDDNNQRASIRNIVREEVKFALEKENSHIKQLYNSNMQKQITQLKRDVLMDIMRQPIRDTFDNVVIKDITSQIMRSIIGKF